MTTIALVNLDFEEDIERGMAREAGIDVVSTPARDPHGIARALADTAADGAVTSYGRFSREVFEACPNLKVVAKTGTGCDNIDVAAATEHGAAVCNVPGYGTEVVSDHAIMLALAVLRRVNELDADVRAGVWDYARHRPLGQARGRTFGVVGMGAIGRATARKAAGLGFSVVCASRSLVPGTRTVQGWEVLALDELLACADVVSLHVALTPETRHVIDERRLALMKPGAVIVNTARGAVVDTRALAEALERGHLWGAGLDVFEDEPIDASDAILSAPHTVLTPHAAYWSEESGDELRRRAMQGVIDVLTGRTPADCLNPEVLSR